MAHRLELLGSQRRYSSLTACAGSRVCVRCESQAIRKALGYRCQGHGVVDRATRWSALSAAHCHGKWVRLESDQPEPDDDPSEVSDRNVVSTQGNLT